VFTELGLVFTDELLLLGDNTVEMLNSCEDIVSEKNKCTQLSHYYIRERENFFDIHHVSTKMLVADLHTKAVPPCALEILVGHATGAATKPFYFERPRKFEQRYSYFLGTCVCVHISICC
jgi:hypothetical protein